MLQGKYIVKNKILLSALAFATSLVAQQALAANGVINFTGEIVKSACDVTSGSKNIDVQLGKWPTTALASAGQTTSPQSFKINVTNCDAGNYTVRLDGTAVDSGANSDLLAVTGGATNVGIQVTGLNNKVVPLNKALTDGYTFTSDSQGNGVADLKAFYKATGAATEGQANAVANFSIEYK